MGYADLTDAEVFAYARERRAERLARQSKPITLRISHAEPDTPKATLKGCIPLPWRHFAGYSRIASMFTLQKRCCYLCGDFFSNQRRPTREHVIPKAESGQRFATRHILLACAACNHAKQARPAFACELLLLEAINLRLAAINPKF